MNNMNEFRNIETTPLSNISEIKQPSIDTSIDLYSPAMRIFTDFSKQRPLILEQSTSIEDAVTLMKKTHVRLKLIVDNDEDFKGVISLEDLLSVKVVQAQQRTGLSRSDLTVGDVMTHKDHLHAIPIHDFKHARIGDVLSTMKNVGEQHALVLDVEAKCIVGIVSASEISRSLHIPIVISKRANSFADIYRAVSD